MILMWSIRYPKRFLFHGSTDQKEEMHWPMYLSGIYLPAVVYLLSLPVRLEDSPAYALGNYTGDIKNADVFANLVKESDKDSKSDKKEAETVRSGDPNTAVYSEESLVGYRWYDTKNIPVMYPFGYGLTYTTFDYSTITD